MIERIRKLNFSGLVSLLIGQLKLLGNAKYRRSIDYKHYRFIKRSQKPLTFIITACKRIYIDYIYPD